MKVLDAKVFSSVFVGSGKKQQKLQQLLSKFKFFRTRKLNYLKEKLIVSHFATSCSPHLDVHSIHRMRDDFSPLPTARWMVLYLYHVNFIVGSSTVDEISHSGARKKFLVDE